MIRKRPRHAYFSPGLDESDVMHDDDGEDTREVVGGGQVRLEITMGHEAQQLLLDVIKQLSCDDDSIVGDMLRMIPRLIELTVGTDTVQVSLPRGLLELGEDDGEPEPEPAPMNEATRGVRYNTLPLAQIEPGVFASGQITGAGTHEGGLHSYAVHRLLVNGFAGQIQPVSLHLGAQRYGVFELPLLGPGISAAIAGELGPGETAVLRLPPQECTPGMSAMLLLEENPAYVEPIP